MSAKTLPQIRALYASGQEIFRRKSVSVLLDCIASEDDAIEEFNMGFDAFENGETINDEPPGLKHDMWRVGWVWAQYCAQE